MGTIRKSFIEQKQCVDCTLDYFNNQYGQGCVCQCESKG